MTDFTISVKSWRFGEGEVGTTVDPVDEEWIIVEYPLTDDPDEKHMHAVPLSGVAFRMEILGLTDPNDVMDIMLKEMNTPEDTGQSIYPKAVEAYYESATSIAKALTEEVQEPSIRSSLHIPDMEPEGFLSHVRELLRGGSSTSMRSESDSPLMRAVSKLEDYRTSSIKKVRDLQKPVKVEETKAMGSLRQAIGGKSGTISSMADKHAHRAMETGAYHYARNLRRKEKGS